MGATPQAFATQEGSHPIDARMEAAGLVGWLVESLLLLVRQWMLILPFALVFGGLLLALPYIDFSDRSSNFIVKALSTYMTALLSAAILMSGFALVAREEGLPHAVGELAPLGQIIPRMLVVILVWLLLFQGFAYVFGQLLELVARLSAIQQLLLWMWTKFGPWTLVIVLWLFSPLFFIAWALSQLSQVLCVRTDLSVVDIFRTTCSEIFGQLGRLVMPSWLVSLFLILLARALFTPFSWLSDKSGPWLPSMLFGFAAAAIIIPLSFVLERAYVAWSGRSEAVGELPLPPPDRGRDKLQPMGQTGEAHTTQGALEQVRKVLAERGPEGAAEAACNAIRLRQRPREEVLALLEAVGDWNALAKPLSALTGEFIRNNRGFESVWLAEYGLQRDPAFLGDQADQLVPFAKRLTQTERPDLAQKLLIIYVRQHPQHPQFLNGGLLLARLLMTHGNNPGAARKLLNHLKPLFPTELQIDQLLRQLG